MTHVCPALPSPTETVPLLLPTRQPGHRRPWRRRLRLSVNFAVCAGVRDFFPSTSRLRGPSAASVPGRRGAPVPRGSATRLLAPAPGTRSHSAARPRPPAVAKGLSLPANCCFLLNTLCTEKFHPPLPRWEAICCSKTSICLGAARSCPVLALPPVASGQ